MKKSERHAAIRARCARAIADLYRNATPSYPSIDDDRLGRQFEGWFEGAAEFEIEYLRDGGAYGGNYRKTLEHPANAGRFKSARARKYYVEWKLRECRVERERCNDLDSRHDAVNALWERIGDYGELYQWGRGGRTLAPTHLIVQHGGSGFGTNGSYGIDLPLRDCVDLLRVVESFNRHVADWCRSVPEQWTEYVQMLETEANDQSERDALHD